MKRFIFSTLALLTLTPSLYANTWINAADGQKGGRPVLIGLEGGKKSYVCRAGGIPGKLIEKDGKCYIGYYGKEYAYRQYQVLQDTYGRDRFFYSQNLSDPYLVVGGSENGQTLHICRVRHPQRGFLGGKVVGGVNGKCYYGYYGVEYSATLFEALTDA